MAYDSVRKSFGARKMIPCDLEINYMASVGPEEPYATKGAFSAPPVFAFFRFLAIFLGDDLDTFIKRYRILQIICGALTLGCLAIYTLRHHRGKVFGNPLSYVALAITLLFFFIIPAFRELLSGNTPLLVAMLIMAQIALSDWESKYSRFLQGFLLASAFCFKPNILLVVLFFVTLSFKRRQFGYIAGMASTLTAIFFGSLLAQNISIDTYYKFIVETSSLITQSAPDFGGNISLIRSSLHQPYGTLVTRIILVSLGLLILVLTDKNKDTLQQEIPCLMITCIPWPIFWGDYLLWVFPALWLWLITNLAREESVYLELIFLTLFGWYSQIAPKPFMANATLAILVILYFKRHVLAFSMIREPMPDIG